MAVPEEAGQAVQTVFDERRDHQGEKPASADQQVAGGGAAAALARVYALDIAEIDLSLSGSELALLIFGEGSNGFGERHEVKLLDKAGGITHRGTLDRSEGTVDPRTRLTNVVARVEGAFADPFVLTEPESPAPLSLGEFVEARLFGPKANVFVIPRSAFREEESILIIDKENRIEERQVEALKRSRDYIWVTEGLSDGEKVCITPLDIVARGMKVRLAKREGGNGTQP